MGITLGWGPTCMCRSINGEPPSDPVKARDDLFHVISLVCSVPYHWFRVGFTDRYYDLTVVEATWQVVREVIASGEFPDDTVLHMAAPATTNA